MSIGEAEEFFNTDSPAEDRATELLLRNPGRLEFLQDVDWDMSP
jgi:hypothetical protein